MGSAKTSILFVDDEANLLAGLRRMLRSMRREWDMKFVSSGTEALEILDSQPFRIIVTDIRMPVMDGTELLRRVRRRHPGTVRIVLSGQADRDAILRSVGPIHQYLSKPCQSEKLKTTITRAGALDTLLPDGTLKQQICKMEVLPSHPALFKLLAGELSRSQVNIAEVGEIVARDMGMSTKILQLVGSGFFGTQVTLPHPAEAVEFLGLDIVNTLQQSVQVFKPAHKLEQFPLTEWQQHSVQVAKCAHAICMAQDTSLSRANYAYIAGLLHDAGKLLLATYAPTEYARALSLSAEADLSLSAAESKLFNGVTHPVAGAFLLGLWGFPPEIVHAVAYHHRPQPDNEQLFTVTTAVHAANCLVNELAAAPAREDHRAAPLDTAYLASLGLTDRIAVWRIHCRQAIKEQK
jgi:HD-like signal output (HDOD) protein/ActR/RegA family two-component response regulator